MACLLAFCSCGGPEGTYKSAQNLLSQGKYHRGRRKVESIGSYEDASSLALYCKAVALAEAGDYQNGIPTLEKMGDYKDCPLRTTYYTGRYYEALVEQGYFDYLSSAEACYRENPLFLDSAQRADNLRPNLYQKAEKLLEEGQWDKASKAFQTLGSYSNAADRVLEPYYTQGEKLLADGDEAGAIAAFQQAGEYSNAKERWQSIYYTQGEQLLDAGEKAYALLAFRKAGNYQDAQALTMDLKKEFKPMVAAGGAHTVGLKTDGTVVAVGYNDGGQCDISDWKLW